MKMIKIICAVSLFGGFASSKNDQIKQINNADQKAVYARETVRLNNNISQLKREIALLKKPEEKLKQLQKIIKDPTQKYNHSCAMHQIGRMDLPGSLIIEVQTNKEKIAQNQARIEQYQNWISDMQEYIKKINVADKKSKI